MQSIGRVARQHPFPEEQLIGPAGGTLEDYAQYLGFIMGLTWKNGVAWNFFRHHFFDPEKKIPVGNREHFFLGGGH